MELAPVAIVHDYLTQRGGAERVVLAMHRGFPDAAIFTSLYEPAHTFPELAQADVRVSPLNRIRPLRRHHRFALPALAETFSTMSVDAETVVCSSSGWAHGVRARGRKVVYCHTPARWLYHSAEYLSRNGRLAGPALAFLKPGLRRWDRKAALSANTYLANSTWTRDRIRTVYGIDAEVLHPPSGVDANGTQTVVAGLSGGYYLCVSRLLAYKNVDAVIAAFEHLPDERLVVAGSGPEGSRLRALAPKNVVFKPNASDDELRWLYANARAVIAASLEDFGLVPLEAAAFGTPTIALRFGGYLDSVIEGETGIYFDEPTASCIATALRDLDGAALDADTIRARSVDFSEERFNARLHEVLGASPSEA